MVSDVKRCPRYRQPVKASEGAQLVTDSEVGARLREARTAAQLSQADVARRLAAIGVPFHQTQVGRVEAGQRPLRVVELVAFARVIDVAPGHLLGQGDLDQGPGPATAAALRALDELHVTLRRQAEEAERRRPHGNDEQARG